MTAVLETRALSKYYRSNWTFRPVAALEELELRLAEGEIFGLIGHNGAGKTTALKLILGLLRPSRGEVLFRGRPLDVAARAAIGFLPEQPYFYEDLSVEETLHFFARLHGIPAAERGRRIARLIEELHLGPKRRARIRTLSKGTLQRVGIAQALVNQPRLLILDEPMSGLDPAGRHHMRELIRAQPAAGTTVVFSSHVLPDAEALCDRVGILARGRLRELVELRSDVDPAAYLVAVRRVTDDVLARLGRLAAAPPAPEGSGWTVQLPGPGAVRDAVDAVHGAGGVVERVVPVRPSLEERFLAWVKEGTALD